jgi:excisionase family DNA binding protein
MEDREDYVTVEDAAELLGVHPQTVRRWLREERMRGTLLSRRAGYRIRRSEVDRVLERGLREGKERAAT